MGAFGSTPASALDDDWLLEPLELERDSLFVAPHAAAKSASAATSTEASSRRGVDEAVMRSPPVADSVVRPSATATRRAAGVSGRAPRGRAGRDWVRAPSRSAGHR